MAARVDHGEDLDVLRERLAALQLSQIVHNRRAIVLIEGLPGSGKKAALKEIAAALDPCHFTVHSSRFDRRESADGHWLARYWRALPSAGNTTIFFRGWYRRVIEDRLLGRVEGRALDRAFDEINEFEAQQLDAGTLVAKLFFTSDPAVQDRRLAEHADCPWRRTARTGPAIRSDSEGFADAFADLKSHTDTRWSPWALIDGNDEEAAARFALDVLVGAWDGSMPSEPPQLVQTIRAA